MSWNQWRKALLLSKRGNFPALWQRTRIPPSWKHVLFFAARRAVPLYVPQHHWPFWTPIVPRLVPDGSRKVVLCILKYIEKVCSIANLSSLRPKRRNDLFLEFLGCYFQRRTVASWNLNAGWGAINSDLAENKFSMACISCEQLSVMNRCGDQSGFHSLTTSRASFIEHTVSSSVTKDPTTW